MTQWEGCMPWQRGPWKGGCVLPTPIRVTGDRLREVGGSPGHSVQEGLRGAPQRPEQQRRVSHHREAQSLGVVALRDAHGRQLRLHRPERGGLHASYGRAI